MDIAPEQWQGVRTAVRRAGDRFVELLRASPPDVLATEHWSVAQTAAHLAAVASWYAFMVQPDGRPHPYRALESQIATTNVDTLSALNEEVLAAFPERDPRRLADGLATDLERLLAATTDRDPAELMTWLGKVPLPLAGMFAHLLNETLIHGWDIARATGAGWTIPPADAAWFLELFLIGVTRYGEGRLLDTGKPPPAGRIAVEFRSDHTTPVMLVLQDGRVSAVPPDRSVDVRVRFDPATMVLVMFYRASRLRAALTGKLRVRGPRPWLLPRFLGYVRMPR